MQVQQVHIIKNVKENLMKRRAVNKNISKSDKRKARETENYIYIPRYLHIEEA